VSLLLLLALPALPWLARQAELLLRTLLLLLLVHILLQLQQPIIMEAEMLCNA
jgi:hypothetical protein